MSGMQLPVKITRSKKCPRCTMRFKITFEECPHCKDIPDGRMLEEHIQKHHDRLQANTKLGFTFLGITLLIATVLILIAAAK